MCSRSQGSCHLVVCIPPFLSISGLGCSCYSQRQCTKNVVLCLHYFFLLHFLSPPKSKREREWVSPPPPSPPHTHTVVFRCIFLVENFECRKQDVEGTSNFFRLRAQIVSLKLPFQYSFMFHTFKYHHSLGLSRLLYPVKNGDHWSLATSSDMKMGEKNL